MERGGEEGDGRRGEEERGRGEGRRKMGGEEERGRGEERREGEVER